VEQLPPPRSLHGSTIAVLCRIGQEITLKTPESASQITLDWLTSALPWARAGCEPVLVEVEPGFGGPSLLGRLARVRLAYAAPGCGPSSLIVKFQARSSDWEAQIYRLLSEAGLRSVPQLFGAFDKGTLVIEDLSPARPGTQVQACTLQQARDVLAILAEIHGRFWNDPRVPSLSPQRFASVIDVNMAQCLDPFARRYRELLGDQEAGFTWLWHNAETVAAHRLSEPTTLFHGDVHAENLLFGVNGKTGPILIDWQLAGRGLAANDVSFFLVKSLTVEERRANEERLLRGYYGLLPERARAAYPFARLMLDYRACVTRSMISAIMLVGPRFTDRPDREELADVLARRVIAAVRDLDPVAAIREWMERPA
jgi:thiamine kinase-like enzyme